MPVFVDQLGNSISLNNFPKRIISLVPSQTELLYDLGLENEVVGITKFCVHPKKWFDNKMRVGGTKQLNLKIIHELKPDIIIANKEENAKEQIDELEKHFPVWISDIKTLNDALQMIISSGEITDKTEKAKWLTEEIEKRFTDLSSHLKNKNHKPKTAYFIWRDPYMAAGADTFINDMMKCCGLNNIFENINRYPETTIEDLLMKNCKLLLLASEPYPFKEKHIAELQNSLPNTKIILVDGEMFSWYGSRLLQAPQYFKQLHNEMGK
jgi:ABC-type Fe3+-hydroxamate transport system substrate-binding protein